MMRAGEQSRSLPRLRRIQRVADSFSGIVTAIRRYYPAKLARDAKSFAGVADGELPDPREFLGGLDSASDRCHDFGDMPGQFLHSAHRAWIPWRVPSPGPLEGEFHGSNFTRHA